MIGVCVYRSGSGHFAALTMVGVEFALLLPGTLGAHLLHDDLQGSG